MQKTALLSIGLVFALLIGAAIYMGLSWNDKPKVATTIPEESTETVSPEPQPQAVEAVEEPPPSTIDYNVLESDESGITLMPHITELADRLSDPQTEPKEALNLVSQVIATYTRMFKFTPEGGENREITARLIGKNSRKLAFLPPKHRVINSKGELVDRWGTPYDFHPISDQQIEVRSAGPDRLMYTEDDVVLPSGPNRTRL